MTINLPGPAAAEPADALASSFSASYAGVIAFIAVVNEGSFAKAADRLGIGRSAVSRSVQKLEGQVGARLFIRTTRSNSLTREGEIFFENCKPGVERITQALADMQELREGPPRGKLRISSAVGFGRKVVAPLLSGFRDLYPEIAVDLLLDDHMADFTTDQIDVSFRNGRMEDSQVIARQLIPMQMIVCASPTYAAGYGLPRNVAELADHHCLNFRMASGRLHEWEFKVEGHPHKVLPKAMLTFNDTDLLMDAALDGQGLVQLAGYQVCEHLRSGRLVACLPQYAPDDRGHYICYLSRQQLPSRIRVFIDYMITQVRALDLQCASSPSVAAALDDMLACAV
ncbi:DNA-binding transcriptional LysR family regulator [Luteibacter sp. OK325]|uniref:LysR family transcriptional regulator n=1 Tax=Luteibacter sp. OK325 TaxID=2135670 RepID=UPI000D37CB94|nr:LysR family transcriptional regulator [Luteibacter sp. OK325]PTR30734.1 DNA-binding transcriptional LysR family regulator [Luteibacter sp. OK325]